MPSCLHLQPGSGFMGQYSGLFGLVPFLMSLAGLILGFAGFLLDPFCKYVEVTCKLLEANLESKAQNTDFTYCFCRFRGSVSGLVSAILQASWKPIWAQDAKMLIFLSVYEGFCGRLLQPTWAERPKMCVFLIFLLFFAPARSPPQCRRPRLIPGLSPPYPRLIPGLTPLGCW